MKRIYHPYEKWECYKNGMWIPTTKQEIETQLNNAILFTSNHVEYGKAMKIVSEKWRFGMEHHLTDTAINKKAYIGHAACNYKFGWSEGLVRMAWGHLTDEQRDKANAEAEKYINFWILRHTENGNQIKLFN
jgi:hypothetical protein